MPIQAPREHEGRRVKLPLLCWRVRLVRDDAGGDRAAEGSSAVTWVRGWMMADVLTRQSYLCCKATSGTPQSYSDPRSCCCPPPSCPQAEQRILIKGGTGKLEGCSRFINKD